jgi:methylated-DNA-[protein]-cysteine S-methyltransferase
MSSDQEHLNVSDCVYRQLDEYFRGVRTSFDVELDLVGTPFQRQAWEALRAIPYGQTVSYAQQALSLGSKNLARAVGGANRRNPVSIIVPCHRVIGKSGALTGFAGGLSAKSGLLGHE